MSSEINGAYICPITREVMLTPVAAQPCGHIFERAAIEQWMRQQGRMRERHLLHEHSRATCPLDQREISLLVPQDGLREEIRAFITANPTLFDGKTPSQLEEALLREYAVLNTTLGQNTERKWDDDDLGGVPLEIMGPVAPQEQRARARQAENAYAFLAVLFLQNHRILKQTEIEQLIVYMRDGWNTIVDVSRLLRIAERVYVGCRFEIGIVDQPPGIYLEFSGPAIDRAHRDMWRRFQKHVIVQVQINHVRIALQEPSLQEKALKILRAPLIAGAVIAVSTAVMMMSLLNTSKQSESGV